MGQNDGSHAGEATGSAAEGQPTGRAVLRHRGPDPDLDPDPEPGPNSGRKDRCRTNAEAMRRTIRRALNNEPSTDEPIANCHTIRHDADDGR